MQLSAGEAAPHFTVLRTDGSPVGLAVDPGRTTYAGYGVARGSFWQAWHPRALWKYFKAWLRGEGIVRNKAGDDLLQLGADFVIGADGIIKLTYYSRRSDDRPAVDALLSALDG